LLLHRQEVGKMADGIYVGMCGAVAREQQLEAVADNLANAQTPGFKSARPAFETFLPASGAQDKSYTAAVSTGFDLKPGPTVQTGNPLDVLPDGGDFLTVMTSTGELAYTRDGRMSLDGDGRLTIQGRLVLGRNGQSISVPPGAQPEISSDGSVRVGSTAVADLAVVHLEGPVNRLGTALLQPGAGGHVAPSESQVRVGQIETGNTSAMESVVDMISVQRNFETSMQAIQTYRQLDQRANDVGRPR
jgi:flagellar basal-body rod protein FlgF